MEEEESLGRQNRNFAKKFCLFLLDAASSQIGLFLVVVVYVILGGFLFEYLESSEGNYKKSSIVKSREDCLKELWAITEKLNVLYEKNWTRLVHDQLRKFESSVVALATHDGAEAVEVVDNRWTFGASLLYSLTLITTIGYGRIAPKSAAGRAATIIYAAAGVPLALACLAALGSTLAKAAKLSWTRLSRRCCNSRWKRDSDVRILENHIQLREKQIQNSFPKSSNSGQYTVLPTSSSPSDTPCRRPYRSATIARVRYAMDYEDSPPPSPRQTQTLDRRPVRKFNAHNNMPKSRYQPRPMTPEIRQLIVEECGEDALRERCEEDFDDVDNRDSDGMCQHETPSRVPLICKSPPEIRRYQEKPNHLQPTVSSSPSSTTFDQCHVPISLILLFLTLYICAGAAYFSFWEGWAFLDSVYFCFIALSTIGFGDLLPTSILSSKPTESSRNEYLQIFACCTYLFMGLVLIAMCLSLIQDELVAKCNQWTSNWGWTKT